jgi:RNA polymerase sigma factor (sigma-70 family)
MNASDEIALSLYSQLLTHARYLSNFDRALEPEDLVQGAYLAALKANVALDDEHHALAYLRRAVRTAQIDANRRRTHHTVTLEEHIPSEEQPTDERAIQRARLSELMDQASYSPVVALLIQGSRGYTDRELAEAWGVPRHTVKNTTYRWRRAQWREEI